MIKKIKTNFWIVLIMLLAVLFIGVTGWSFYMAKRGVSPVVDSAYYNLGLRYDKTQMEFQAARDFGWEATTEIKENRFEVRLFSEDNTPIANCKGTLLVHLQQGQPTHLTSLVFEEKKRGVYSIELPYALEGEILVQMTLGKNKMTIQRSLLLVLKHTSRK